MNDILTKDGSKLNLFEKKVVIDKKLPKWVNAEKGLGKTEVETKTNSNFEDVVISELDGQISAYNRDVDSEVNISTKWLPLYEIAEGVNFDTIASAGIKELTRYIAENKLKFVIGGYGSLGNTQNNVFLELSDVVTTSREEHKNENVLNKIVKFFKKHINTNKEKFEIDALQFFKLVKLTSKESVNTYRDRVSDYLKQVYNAATIGQTALLENLIRGMVTNKYESVLYAEGYYYAVNETQMVDFVKKCEKGIKLEYIKNFTRPIPQNVVDKINHINKLEVFDNYVVLYYDPDGKIYQETAREEAKRKDPIIFGLIAGSEKLYYIADWVDEYCDLTLEKFIDTIGVNKEDLKL